MSGPQWRIESMLRILLDIDQGRDGAVDACFLSMRDIFELPLNSPSKSLRSSQSQISDGFGSCLGMKTYFITCGSTVVD